MLNSKWDVSIKSLPLGLPMEEEVEIVQESKADEWNQKYKAI